jgi:VWFA-related protein
MKTKLYIKNNGGTWLKYNFLKPVFIISLIICSFFTTIIEGTELNRFSTKSTILDSLTLIYNQIDAANFPRIVSLVTVTNETGYIVEKLDENNFEVHEDNVRELPIEVIELTDGGTGISVVLVIDRSGSMKNAPIADAKQAASTFVGLMQIKDKSAIVSFSNTSRTDQQFSSNKDSLIAAIANINADGKTAVFDAVVHAVYLMSDDLQNRAIILLTDGADNSSIHSYQEALTACTSNEIRVFSIGLGLKRNSSEENVLKDLASATGGMYYYSPNSSDLEEIYRMISKLLHHRYQVSYTTHNPAKDGTLRHVRIDVMVKTSASWDTASYWAPYERANSDTVIPPDPVPPEPPFEVVPNPFTPNDDGYNDWAEFKKGDTFPQECNVSIMDRSGRLIRHLNSGENIWDGKDKSGITMLPGVYLYFVKNGNRVVHRGLIQLIR